jgi:GDP-4-dehydro-6-deoxy-D-mannose reductase
MKTVLVLGAAGFTGRHFCRFIARNTKSDELQIRGADVHPDPANPEILVMDLANKDNLTRLLSELRPNYIVNLAGVVATSNFEVLTQLNFVLSLNLLSACIDCKTPLEKILLIGSAAEYGVCSKLPVLETHPLNPVNPYGLTKVMQTKMADYFYRTYNLPVCLVRPFNLIGPGMNKNLVVPSFCARIEKAKPEDHIEVGDLSATRDFVDIEDACAAYMAVLLNGTPGKTYNVCSGQSTSIKTIVDYLIKISGKKLSYRESSELKQRSEAKDIYGSYSLLKGELGWQPTKDIYQSLDRVWNEDRHRR